MKSFVAAIAIAALASEASAATCGSSVLSALLTNANIQQCGTDSGYAFTAAEIPDQATIDKMCASTACNTLLADVQAMN
ncbi:elicitin-like protein [Phytophthora infestans T30-4]|nr:elicitin-like protein [Phytophthora infestans T30-4]EEY65239.1 elicitin-like protein [Phytophthora infestans T30-4]|eukprot:XP_002897303.1 elicitin-like protein [Phytophthora infestans T30-4]